MTNKKLLAVMPVMILALGFAVSGCATKPVTSGDGLFEYRLTTANVIGGPKGAGITNYFGTESDVVIPAQIDGYPVFSIVGTSLFSGKRPGAFEGKLLTSVVLPDGLKIIGNKAFANNQITDITIPDGVRVDDYSTKEDTSAFLGNPLTNLTLGKDIRCFSSDSLGTLTLYYLGNGSKPGAYSRDGDAWTYNGSKLELPAILTVGGSSEGQNESSRDGGIKLAAIDGESFGALSVNKYALTIRGIGSSVSTYWIPTGPHTVSIAETESNNAGGGFSMTTTTGRTQDLRENFQSGIIYRAKEKPDDTGIVIEQQGNYSPAQ
ncbi:MAG: leucine-rich repeat domain-containing protein [Spirochaetaceae bacterium]|nr:leucine-rich repeat domain-containing protein [Spirochaetaceae bacterium]